VAHDPRHRPDRRAAALTGRTGRAAFLLDRVPGYAVGFTGLGHALPRRGLARLVLRHDHCFPAGRPASARHGVNDMTKKARESWTLVLVAIAGAGRRWLGSGQAVLPPETERTRLPDRPQ